MSMVFNMVGGGGGEKPQLLVTVPDGYIVTCTKDTTTLTSAATTGIRTFNLPQWGVWTVGATLDDNTFTKDVDVSTVFSTTPFLQPVASTSPISGVTYTDGIATFTAQQMSSYGKAISNNIAITQTTSVVYIDDGSNHYKISLGDSITLQIQNTYYDFIVIGFNHDYLTDAVTAYGEDTATHKAGFTLQTKECLSGVSTWTNNNNWATGTYRSILMNNLKATMDTDWQNVIKPVNKQTSQGAKVSTIVISSDTIFALSDIEVFGVVVYSFSGEGYQYAWYVAGNSAIKTANNTAALWRLRSPCASNVNASDGVSATGTIYAPVYGTSTAYTACAFCI